MIRRAVVVLVGIGLIVLAWFVAVRPVGDERLRAKLHAVADGNVINVVALDDVYTRLTVSWYDTNGITYSSRFDTDTYPWHPGDSFFVLYDAKRPTRRALSEEPDYTNNGALRTDARVQGGALAGGGLLLVMTPPLLELRRRLWRRSLSRGEVLTFDQLALPTGPPYAWDAPGVQARWKQYGGSASALLYLGAAGALVMALVLVRIHQNDAGLLRHGAHAQGVVLHDGGYESKFTQNWVSVRYTDAAGHEHVGDLHGPSPDDLSPGTHVEVVYDKHAPSRFRTRGYANHANLTNDAMFLGPIVCAFLFISAGWVFFTVRFGRAVMRHHPWVPVTIVEGDLGSLLETHYFEFVMHVPGEPRVRARLGSASKNATAEFGMDKGDSARICPGRGRRFLIDGDSLSRPYVALLPRNVWQSRQWARVAR